MLNGTLSPLNTKPFTKMATQLWKLTLSSLEKNCFQTYTTKLHSAPYQHHSMSYQKPTTLYLWFGESETYSNDQIGISDSYLLNIWFKNRFQYQNEYQFTQMTRILVLQLNNKSTKHKQHFSSKHNKILHAKLQISDQIKYALEIFKTSLTLTCRS